jgi:hypothetical protein
MGVCAFGGIDDTCVSTIRSPALWIVVQVKARVKDVLRCKILADKFFKKAQQLTEEMFLCMQTENLGY